MAMNPDLLRVKAESTINAFKVLTAKQREQFISESMGKDFNRLRELVIEAKPDLEPLLPAKLELIKGDMGDGFNERYQDIHAFYEQVAALLKPPPGHFMGTRVMR